jgi:hypothetical protein
MHNQCNMYRYTINLTFMAFIFTLLLIAAGCSWHTGNSLPPIHAGAEQPLVRYASGQGWSKQTSNAFHFTSQGSELIPYDWFLALELPGSSALFKDHLDRYGFLYEPEQTNPKLLNPDHLPIGFALHITQPPVRSMPYGSNPVQSHTGRS